MRSICAEWLQTLPPEIPEELVVTREPFRMSPMVRLVSRFSVWLCLLPQIGLGADDVLDRARACLASAGEHLRWEIAWGLAAPPPGYERGATSHVEVYTASTDDLLGVCWEATRSCGLYLTPQQPDAQPDLMGGWTWDDSCDRRCREEKFAEVYSDTPYAYAQVRPDKQVRPPERSDSRKVIPAYRPMR